MFENFRRLQYNGCRRQGDKLRRACAAAASQGYWPGGNPPYGLRRLLLDGDGNALQLLKLGERRTTREHRVALVLGEPTEVAAIRRIFREFVDRGRSATRIADGLNASRVPSPGGDHWTARHVLACLRNKAYASPITYRRTRNRKTPSGASTPDGWVHTPEACDGIISQEQFQRAQEMLA